MKVDWKFKCTEDGAPFVMTVLVLVALVLLVECLDIKGMCISSILNLSGSFRMSFCVPNYLIIDSIFVTFTFATVTIALE